MRSLSFKLAFLRMPNILQVFPAAGTASIFPGAGSLLVPYPAPRASCASGLSHRRARRDPEPLGVGCLAWPPRAAAKRRLTSSCKAAWGISTCGELRPLHWGDGTGKRWAGGGLLPTPASSSAGWLLQRSRCRCLWINWDFSPPLGNSHIVKPKDAAGRVAAVGSSLPKIGFFPFNFSLVSFPDRIIETTVTQGAQCSNRAGGSREEQKSQQHFCVKEREKSWW